MIHNNMSDYKIAPANVYDGESILSDERFLKSVVSPPSALIIEKKIAAKYKSFFTVLFGMKPSVVWFGGECWSGEVERITAVLSSHRPKTVVAAGGGKLLDTAKLVSERINAKIITVPTSAATCAAFTAISPTYHKNGIKHKTLDLKKAPDACIIDYDILIRQPVELLTSGIADAMAKYYESRAFICAHPSSVGPSVRTAYAMSDTIRENLLRSSAGAIKALKTGKINDDFKEIIYSNLVLTGLVSGIGGKGCRAVAAHALASGLTFIEETRKALHGHRVGWGILVQLVLEERKEDLETLRKFFIDMAVPVSLKHLGLKKVTYAGLKKAMSVAASPGESMRFLRKKITLGDLWEAVKLVENKSG